MRILVAEDDRELAAILCRVLKEQLNTVEVAHDGESVKYLALTHDFDLIILDIMLPKVDGFGVCHAVRSAGKATPVIMLTARDEVDDRIMGLDAGADDYITKPFSMNELFARIRAVMRRASGRVADKIKLGALQLDPRSNYVVYCSRKIRLTAKEFSLLQFFMENPDKILTRTEILDRVWDSNYDGLGNVVDVYVNYLRNKLEERGEPRIIETVRGRGYALKQVPNVS